MLTYILRDHAIRVLPWWLGIGAAITLHLFVISVHEDFQKLSWAWVPWFPVALYLLVIRVERRASELDLSLPIPARRMWLAHVLALGLGATAMLTVCAALMALRSQVVAVPGWAAEVTVTTLRFATGLGIVLALTQSYEAALVRRSRNVPHILFLLAVLGVVPVIVLWLDGGWLLLLLAAALALGLRTWSSLPPALVLELAEPEPRVADAVPAPRPVRPRSPAVHRWHFAAQQGPVVRLARLFWHIHAHSGRRPQQLCLLGFGYPLCIVLGLGLSGGAPPIDDELEGFLLVMLVCCCGFLMIPVALTLRLLTMLDPLPISRRFLFAVTMLPAFAALALGFVIGAVGGDRGGASAAAVALVLALVAGLWHGQVVFATRRRREQWGFSVYAVYLVLLVAFLPLRLAAVKEWFDLPIVYTEAFAARLAAAFPGGEAALVGVSLVLLGVAYVLAEARFCRFEVVDRGADDYWLFADFQPLLKASHSGGAS